MKKTMSRNIWMRLHKSFLTQANREWQEIRRKAQEKLGRAQGDNTE